MTLCVVSLAMTGAAHSTWWFLTSHPPSMKMVSGHVAGVRSQSKNNLKQIGIGLWNYLDTNGTLPAGGTFLSDGTQGHSWMTWMLPYYDQASLFAQIRLAEPWNSPHNSQFTQREIIGFRHPHSRGMSLSQDVNLADYAANQYVMGANWGCSQKEITDGLSNTLFAGEVTQLRRPWADPRNYRDPGLGINRSSRGFGGHQPKGALMLFGDGHVDFISENIDPQVLRKLGTPNGGEVLTPEEEQW